MELKGNYCYSFYCNFVIYLFIVTRELLMISTNQIGYDNAENQSGFGVLPLRMGAYPERMEHDCGTFVIFECLRTSIIEISVEYYYIHS